MDFDEILGLEDIDAEEMVLVVGGGTVLVNTKNGQVACGAANANEASAIAQGIEIGAPFTFTEDNLPYGPVAGGW